MDSTIAPSNLNGILVVLIFRLSEEFQAIPTLRSNASNQFVLGIVVVVLKACYPDANMR